MSHLARQLIVSSNIIAIQCLEADRCSLSLQVHSTDTLLTKYWNFVDFILHVELASNESAHWQVLKPALATLLKKELKLADKKNLLTMTEGNLAQVRAAIGVDQDGHYVKK